MNPENSSKIIENKENKENKEITEKSLTISSMKNSLLIAEDEDAEQVILEKRKKKIIIIVSIISVILLLITSFFIYKYYNKVEISDSIIYIPQPLSERNTFRYYTLKNDIKVLLINPNDKTDTLRKTQIALTVGVGSQSDPKSYIGLTHLYEHLLFTGTEKYSGKYMDTVIDEYKGIQNGETNDYSTSYYFEIDDKGVGVLFTVLGDAVGNAIFSKETVKEEVMNINSEVQDKMISNRSMNYYKFVKSIGDRKSKMFFDGWKLFDPEISYVMLTEELEAFHKQYYSSNIMTLVVISNEDPEKLKNMIDKEIGEIPNLNISRPFFEQIIPSNYPFSETVFGSIFYLKQEIDVPSLTFFFTFPSEMKIDHFQPFDFLQDFIDHRANGSFKYKLEESNLTSNISLESVFQDVKNQVFAISFDIKEEDQNVRKLIMEFFSFIEFLKNFKDIEEIYKKIQLFSKYDFIFNIDANEFKFYNTPTNLMDRAKRFSEIILNNEPNLVFTDDNILYQFDEKKWEDFITNIKIENCFILYESKLFIENIEEDENSIPIIEIDDEKTSDKENETNQSDEKIDEKKDEIIEKTTQEQKKQENLIKKKKNLKLKMRRVLRILEEKNNDKELKNKENKDSEDSIESGEEEEELEDKYKIMENIKDLDLNPEEIELTQKVKFEENMTYEHFKFSDKLLKNFYHKLNKSNTYVLLDIDLDILNKYDMNDTCDVPNFKKSRKKLRKRRILEKSDEKKSKEKSKSKSKGKNSDEKTKGDNKKDKTVETSKEKSFSEEERIEKDDQEDSEEDEENGEDSDKKKEELDTNKLIDNLFNYDTDLDPESEKIIESIEEYKMCLTNEFFEDSITIVPKLIKSENNLSLFFKRQRVSFQPKLTIYVEIGQKDLFDTFLFASYEERVDIQIFYHIFCEYIQIHMIEKFSSDFLQGDRFICYLSEDHVNLMIFLELLTNKVGTEKKYFDELKKFKDPKMFDKFKLNNIKIRTQNHYSDYDSFSSLDLAFYKLNNILDRNSIDRDEGEKFDLIKKLINEKEPKELSKITNNLFTYSTFNVIVIGNYQKSKTWNLAVDLQKHFTFLEHDIGLNRKMILSKLINKPEMGTSVLRLQNPMKGDPNNVYITYFFVGVLSKTMRIALRVLNYYLDLHVFRVLRTNLNLGYVADSLINEYFQREGIVIYLQGINFEPHTVEKTINKLIIDFFEILQEKTDSEIKGVAKQEFDLLMNMKGNLNEMSEKIFDNYEVLQNNGDKTSYHIAYNRFEPNMVLSLAEKIFRDRKFQRRYIIEVFENLTDDIKEYKLDPKFGIIPGREYKIKELEEFYPELNTKENINQ